MKVNKRFMKEKSKKKDNFKISLKNKPINETNQF